MKRTPIMIDDKGVHPLEIKDPPKVNKMSPAEFIKYAADNHIKFTLPEDTRKYPGQQCQDEKINNAFRNLHKNIVDEIIGFCNAYGISIDEFHMSADGLQDSIKTRSWQPCTDSSLRFEKYSQEYKDVISMKKVVSEDEFNKILINEEPFLFSM